MAERFYPILIILLRSLIVTASIVTSGSLAAETVGQRLLKLFDSSDNPAVVEEEFLDPDAAFRFSAFVPERHTVNLMWQIEDGYYLYHDKFSVSVIDSNKEVKLGDMVIPSGKIKVDESFGSMEINTGDIVVALPVQVEGDEEVSLTLQVIYQGCKENSICYPPIKQQVPLVLSGVSKKERQ